MAESGLRKLRARLGLSLDELVGRQGEKALENLLDTIKAAEPEFKDAGSRVEFEVLRRLSEERDLLLHRYSLDRYGAQLVETVQRELVTGVARGQGIRELTERIAGIKDSVLEGAKARAELIVRMELNRAYNDAHLSSIRGARKVLDDPDDPDPLMKKASEYTDLRNHAISRVLHGQVVGPDELFHAPRALVEAEHQAIQAARRQKKLPVRRLSGIVWQLQGADYVGLNYPAHFWERGRIVGWRRSWEGEKKPAVVKENRKKELPENRQEEPATNSEEGSDVVTMTKGERQRGFAVPASDSLFPAEWPTVAPEVQMPVFFSDDEQAQALDLARMLGGGRLLPPVQALQGIETYLEKPSGDLLGISLKSGHSTKAMPTLLNRIGRNLLKIADAKRTGQVQNVPVVVYATPMSMSVKELSEFAEGRFLKMVSKGEARALLFRCRDGLISVESIGVRILSEPPWLSK